MTELGRALPDVALYPDPVVPPALRGGGEPGAMRLLVEEYTKFLVAAVGLAPLFPRPPAP